MENKSPTHVFGRGDDLQMRMGLDPVRGPMVAAIIVFAGNIENHLEQAIWRLEGFEPDGTRPPTDAKPTSELVGMLNAVAQSMELGAKRSMLDTWCEAARSALEIRNNIAHGLTVSHGTTVTYIRNHRWGVERKRPFGSLWTDISTLTMIRDSFATLLRIIYAVSKGEPDTVSDETAARALREARSILGEFADWTYNPSFEKY